MHKMALNGIDAQIMAQRAVDAAKYASNLNKKNELMQDYMALQRKAEDEVEDTIVMELERKEDPLITREHKGTRQDAADQQDENKQKNQTDAENEEDEDEPGIISSNRIDIRI